MNIHDLAKQIDGVQYRKENTRFDKNEAKTNRIVVVYGASDDLMEFDGAISDEIGAYDGTEANISTRGLVIEPDCDCDAARELHDMKLRGGKSIKAIWAPDDGSGASWKYETSIPHATFNVMEDDDLYCVGIVFSLDELGETQ